MLKFFGQIPYTFDFTKRQFTVNRWSTIYSILFMQSLFIAYPLVLTETYSEMDISVYRTNIIVKSAHFMTVNTMALLKIVLIMNLHHRQKIVDFLNGTVDLVVNLKKFEIRQNFLLVLSVIKLLIVPFFFGLVFFAQPIANKGFLQNLLFLFLIIPPLIIFNFVSVFVIIIIWIRLYFESMNAQLNQFIIRANSTIIGCNKSKYQNMVIACDISDEVDRIATLHFQLTALAKRFNKIFSIHILSTLIVIGIQLTFQVNIIVIKVRCDNNVKHTVMQNSHFTWKKLITSVSGQN